MLNRSLKKDAISALEQTHRCYESRAEEVTTAAEELMETRQRCSLHVIGEVESYINQLANEVVQLERTPR